ncbi:MAG: sensor domain-containing protein [Acidimicrobiales bacterium]|nr:sensor domain-containing protein [Acidimicrobiales bacterium]
MICEDRPDEDFRALPWPAGRSRRPTLRSPARVVITWGSEPNSRVEEIARTIIETPFTRRTWSELLFLVMGMPIALLSFAFIGVTLATGVVLAITFIGLAIIAIAVRGARGIGGIRRRLAAVLLNEAVEEPLAFSPRPGYLGWLQSALRDRTGWKAMAYVAIKVPFAIVAFFTAFSVWWDAFRNLTYPSWGWGTTTTWRSGESSKSSSGPAIYPQRAVDRLSASPR